MNAATVLHQGAEKSFDGDDDPPERARRRERSIRAVPQALRLKRLECERAEVLPEDRWTHSTAEANGMNGEAHGGVGNLHMLGAMVSPGLYYERGLLHPFVDDDATPAWLNAPVDPMDDEGFVHISPAPGLGYDINWDHIKKNLVDRPPVPADARPPSLRMGSSGM
jgi:hypothetical protein